MFPARVVAGLGGLVVFVAVCSMGAQSCQSIAPGQQVGTKVCLECHNGDLAPDVTEFKGSPHMAVGCEACHGPGYLHVRNGGRGGLFIDGLTRYRIAGAQYFCNRCHKEEADTYVQSEHAKTIYVSCLTCHNVHSKKTLVKTDEDNALCLKCHGEEKFPDDAAISAHTFHDVDPEGTGASRCSFCHMPPLDRVKQFDGPRSHSMWPIPPIASNEAAAAGVSPVPPNSCTGMQGCHDGSVTTAPVFNVDDPHVNALVQILYNQRYGGDATEIE